MCPGGIPGELARRRLDQAPHLVDRAVTDIGVLAAEFCRQILLGDAEIGKATQELDTLLRRHGVVADHAGRHEAAGRGLAPSALIVQSGHVAVTVLPSSPVTTQVA